MAAVNYEALRSIISGHVSGTNYDLDLILEQADQSVKPTSSSSGSLGGQRETVLQRIDYKWRLTIGSITSVNKDAVREFLDSVQGGEVFSLDVYGSVAVPDNPENVTIEPGYSITRINGGDLFSVSIQATKT